MAKKERLDFDYEEFFNERLEDTAIVTWSTRHQAFTFAFYINQLYSLNLERCDEIELEAAGNTVQCSVYSYISKVNQQVFFLVDTPAAIARASGSGIFFDKTFLIIGPDSFELGERIYNETAQLHTGDIANSYAGRSQMLQTFVDSGIVESAMFDFSDPDRPETTYFPKSTNNPTLQKRKARFLKEERKFISDVLMALDDLIPDFDS